LSIKQRLLIADRDAELCEVFQRFLTERGYEVETSTDGLDCLAKLRLVVHSANTCLVLLCQLE
jgi:CheY-like chemotaxis protein